MLTGKRKNFELWISEFHRKSIIVNLQRCFNTLYKEDKLSFSNDSILMRYLEEKGNLKLSLE